MPPESSPHFVLLACSFGLLAGLLTFCVAVPIGIIYWTLTVLLAIAGAILSSWRVLRSGASRSWARLKLHCER